MEKIKKNFGFGFMRLPLTGEAVDLPQVQQMVDRFMEAGFNYFDTAHPYLGGKSEQALKQCLTSRYPRESFVLVNKLSNAFFEKEEDILPFFENQLQWCGVDYFDIYLMHAQSAVSYEKYKKCGAYEIGKELKAQGKIRHFGISFHDTPQVLDQILTENPHIEVVQLQFNYMDIDSPKVQSMACYEVCRKHGKPVIIMEPVKGGTLVNLPEEAHQVFRSLGGDAASFAIRYAAGFPGVMMVLSGMSTLEQLEENISFMAAFQPLNEKEQAAIDQVREILKAVPQIPCTGCRYCVEGCPKQISIPDLFSVKNQSLRYPTWDGTDQYGWQVSGKVKASDCIGCGKCEKICPQHLAVRELLRDVAQTFER